MKINSNYYERDVLATLITAKDARKARSVINKLSADMFASRINKTAYSAILELSDSNELIDPVSVMDRMKSIDPDSDHSTLDYVLGIISDSVCSEASLTSYAKRVRQSYYVRDAASRVQQASELINNLQDISKVSDLAAGIEEIFNGLMLETNDQKPVKFKDIAKDYITKLNEKLHGEESNHVVLTHMKDLDDLTGGFNKTDLILIGGCPGSGKSELTVNLIRGIVKSGKGALMFSLEMSNHQLVERAISGEAGLPVSNLRNPKQLTESGFAMLSKGLGELVDTDFYMTDQAGLTVEEIIMAATRHKHDHPNTSLIAVDYAGLLSLPKGDRHDIALGTVSRKLKQLAKDIETPVILLTQLNSKNIDARAINDRRPKASDIKDSSRLEDDADLILLCYRHKIHDERAPDVAEIILAKARHAIRGAICYTRFINGHFLPTRQDLAKNEIDSFIGSDARQPKSKNF